MAGRTLKKATTASNVAVQYEIPGTVEMPMPRLIHPSELDKIRVTRCSYFETARANGR